MEQINTITAYLKFNIDVIIHIKIWIIYKIVRKICFLRKTICLLK